MRVFKIAFVSVMMAASVLAGGAASAAPAPHMRSATVWCC
jgi:hypothetical protein